MYLDPRRREDGTYDTKPAESRELTIKQEKFAKLFARGVPQTMAAEIAGYQSPAVEASRLKQSPAVRARVRELVALRIERHAIEAETFVRQVMLDAQQKMDVRVKCAFRLLDMGGFTAESAKDKANQVDKRDLRNVSQADLLKIIEAGGRLIGANVTDVIDQGVDIVDDPLASEASGEG